MMTEYEKPDLFVVTVRFLCNLMIVFALPFQFIVFRVLWRSRRISEYASPFYLIVQMNCFLNILQTIVKLLVDSPSTTDAFREAFAAKANLVGKLINFRSYYISMIIVSNLAYLTMNRLSVILHVDTYRKKHTLKPTIKKLFLIWLFWTIVCMPKVWPVQYQAIRLEAIDYNYQIIPSQRIIQRFYLMFSIVLTFSVLILIYVSYIIIGVQLYKAKTSYFKKTVVNATFAALMMSSGMMICIGIVAADFIAGFFGFYLLSQNYYYLIFNLGIDLNVFITPFSVILLTSDVRKKLSCSKPPEVLSMNTLYSNVKKAASTNRF